MQLSGKLLASSVVAALGGFLFGFDVVVISGAEQRVQSLWGLSDGLHGLAMSAALWGTVIGALAGGLPTDRLGRKGTLLGIGVLYFVSAAWSALAGDVYSFMIARFIGGIGVGVSTVAAPLYISEISPAALRGRLTGMFQFNIVFGILVAFISNALLQGIGANAWRWMLGVEAFPALLYTLLVTRIPESPRWLIVNRGRRDEARAALAALNPRLAEEEVEAAIAQITSSAGRAVSDARGDASVEQTGNPYAASAVDPGSPAPGGLTKPITFAFLIAFFNQLSGINAVLYFAPRIFEMTGLGAQSAMLQSVGIGVTNLVFTMLGLALIDQFGRKTLLIIGSLGYIGALTLCSWAFFTETFAIVPGCIFAFIAAHAVGQGAVIWVFISEIFPNRHRALGNSIGCGAHWVFAALITLVFPAAAGAIPAGYIFAFFAGMMVLQLVWVLTSVPETRGVPLEEMQARIGAE